MKLTLAEPKYLKESITIISDLVNEATFKITKEYIEMVAMDPANVAMVIFKLLASSFVEYTVEDKVEIAINLSNLKQILRRAKPSDMLSLELEENRLKITLKSNTIRTFSLAIIDLDEKEQRIPELVFDALVEMDSSALNEAIEDVEIVGESVSFKCTKSSFVISAEGDLSKADIEIHADGSTNINCGAESKAKYSVEYLKKMMNGSKLADKEAIRFSKDYPLKLEYKAVDKVMLSFILAPRVEND